MSRPSPTSRHASSAPSKLRTEITSSGTGRPSAWTHRFYHFDLLGNTTAETDANGMVANIIDMEAFGTVLQGGQAGFRLTTKEYDPEAGAYYSNARWYQPGVKRVRLSFLNSLMERCCNTVCRPFAPKSI